MHILGKIDALLVRVIHPVLIVIGLAVALMLVIGILTRMFGAPVFGLEEIMLLAIMWFYMLGAALASRERSHLSADFVRVISKNPKVWRVAALISTAISLVIAVLFSTWAWALFSFGLERGQSTPVFGIPWWISQSSLFVASVLFIVYLVRDLIHEIRGDDWQSGDPAAEVE
ncbi:MULTISPECIES: TRAP transporter small permease [Roseobacteraceae]|uniref:TRAP transporter small permease protein n=1 Tax=Pseudosulfitobacter pseudonitzschiae TaxID=1402135 RepID=A0A221K7T2_9RHOB|nr:MULTISPECIES: TRAP transporter small permease [Roseobacteraceae]ASM75054.1 tripartite ATP-independent periplasmic transporter, DctQ component [Pseudosulfitobacter pseudonitzschiae]